MSSSRKRLFFDIETSLIQGLFFSIGRKISLSPQNIVKESGIICIAWKWAGKREVHHLEWDKNQCEKKMLLEFMKVMNEADEIVAHNGDKFDIAWIRTICAKYEIPMPPTYQSIDTLKKCRSLFRFHSNRLDYVAKFFGLERKGKTQFQWWVDITLNNCQATMAKMVKYCKRDVRVLEKVFDRLNPYMPHRTALSKDARECPECGGRRVKANHILSAAGVEKYNMYCKHGCGKYQVVAASKVKEK